MASKTGQPNRYVFYNPDLFIEPFFQPEFQDFLVDVHHQDGVFQRGAVGRQHVLQRVSNHDRPDEEVPDLKEVGNH
jgi:hypothetical protein